MDTDSGVVLGCHASVVDAAKHKALLLSGGGDVLGGVRADSPAVRAPYRHPRIGGDDLDPDGGWPDAVNPDYDGLPHNPALGSGCCCCEGCITDPPDPAGDDWLPDTDPDDVDDVADPNGGDFGDGPSGVVGLNPLSAIGGPVPWQNPPKQR